MAPSTRNLLIGSSLIVVVGLCTGLVAYYGNALPGRGNDASELVAYIPAGVSGVGFADVRSIMDSEFRQKLRQVMPTGTENETGIDIERDIDTAVAGFGNNGPAGAVVVLRGRFNQAQLEQRALAHGAEQQQYGGRTLLVGMRPQDVHAGPATHTAAVAFLSDDLIALGEVASVRAAIDAEANQDGVTANTDLMRLINSVQGTGDAWMVGRAADITGQPQIPDQVRSQVEGIQWVSFSASIDRDVRGVIRAEARDDERAEQLRKMLAGALAAVKMFGEQDARVSAALNSVQTAGTGPNIELSFLVSPELLDVVAQHGAAPPFAPAPAPAPPQ